MIYLAINGVLGRMGRAIAGLASPRKDTELKAGFDVNAGEKTAVNLSDGLKPEILYPAANEENLKGVHVLIDFSIPEASLEIIRRCVSLKIPIVVGTTGFNPEQEDQIVQASREIPVLKASNMSLGVNLLFALTRMAARALKDKGFDAEIMEIHHNRKKDAPSGTAKSLESILIENMDLNSGAVYGRGGIIGERKKDELGVMALRGGDVAGDHTVFFLGNGERLELKHQASHRGVFAAGALDAAVFLARQGPGLYSMADVLNLS